MTTEEEKIRVTARISKDLDTRIHRFYNSMAPAIIEGLELLAATKEGILTPNDTSEEDKDTKEENEELKARLGDKDKIIGDKEKEIEFLKGQITIKDQQIDKQAFSLQSVIQENSRLNLRLLPEAQTEQKVKKSFFTRVKEVFIPG